MLGNLLKIAILIGILSFVTIVSANELANRNIIPKTWLQQAKLDQITWQNTLWQFNHLIGKVPKPATQTASVNQIWEQTGSEFNSLKDRGLVVAEATRKFVRTQLFSAQAPNPTLLGSSSSALNGPSPTQQPLEKRTIEYAKYLYCKETVKAYEDLNPELK